MRPKRWTLNIHPCFLLWCVCTDWGMSLLQILTTLTLPGAYLAKLYELRGGQSSSLAEMVAKISRNSQCDRTQLFTLGRLPPILPARSAIGQ